MSKVVKVYKTEGPDTVLLPLETDREWMHENRYSYNCMPVALTNKLGWGISFPEDISFIWHGSNKEGLDGDIEVLSGNDNCYFQRGGGVIAFPTNLIFKTDEETSILIMPVPNQFIDGATAFTSILSSSFYTGSLHVVWKITRPGHVFTIKAGTPVAAIIPISLKEIQGSSAILMNNDLEILHGSEYVNAMTEYGKINMRVSDWYKKAVDQNNNVIGKHEVNSFKFIVEDKTNANN